MEKDYLLSGCNRGEVCIVKAVKYPDIKKQKRLCELGLISGTKVQYIKKNKDGGGLIVLRGCVFSIDKTLAESIEVLRGNICKK